MSQKTKKILVIGSSGLVGGNLLYYCSRYPSLTIPSFHSHFPDEFKKTEGIRAMVTTIDTNESHCDHIQRRIIMKIFDSDIEPFLKIQVKDLVEKIGQISDQADGVSKRINIINMKRRV